MSGRWRSRSARQWPSSSAETGTRHPGTPHPGTPAPRHPGTYSYSVTTATITYTAASAHPSNAVASPSPVT